MRRFQFHLALAALTLGAALSLPAAAADECYQATDGSVVLTGTVTRRGGEAQVGGLMVTATYGSEHARATIAPDGTYTLIFQYAQPGQAIRVRRVYRKLGRLSRIAISGGAGWSCTPPTPGVFFAVAG